MALEQLGVDLVEPDLGDDGRVQLHRPLATHLLHDDVGHDIGHLGRAEAPARPRVQPTDAFADRLDARGALAQLAGQRRDVTRGERRQVVADDGLRQ
jgi:hypothetical protein